jgi:alpha-L-rhamnosidase
MKILNWFLFLNLILAADQLQTCAKADEQAAGKSVTVTVERLRCEYQSDPLSIATPKPRLSWIIQSERRGERQTAYRVLVASTPEILAKDQGDLWDSGKVASDQSIQVEYAGRALTSRQQCFWKVCVWDKDGIKSPWSELALWEMGLLAPEDWHAQWIRRAEADPKSEDDFFNDHPAPLLRKEFTVRKPIARARAYISGLGYYELRLNGQRVGDHVLDPGWTTYSKRILYSTYDVTAQLRQGRNAIGIMLGNGWYNPLPLRMFGHVNLREHLTIGKPRVILRLAIDYADGTSESVVTDPTWKTSAGPILRNNVYLGEVYDARREQPGWDEANFSEANWDNAVPAEEPLGPLEPQIAPPIRVARALQPVKRSQPKPGTYIFDFGQNFGGRVALHVKGPAGTKVRMRYGELLYPDGTLNAMTSVPGQIKAGGRDYVYPGTGAPKTAFPSDVYILKGGTEETYVPRFTFHGFRYVEVTGYPGEPPSTALEGQRLSSAVEPAGQFFCSNERFNQIQQMIERTFLSNLFSVESDCPHREKFGYGGDAVAVSEAFLLNYDMAQFYAKMVRDYADAVRPNGGMTETAPFVGIADEGLGDDAGPVGWGTAFVQIQWQLYQHYGERRLLEEQYPLTRKWVEFLHTCAKDGILDNGISDHESLVPKPRALTGTAFYYHNVRLLSQIAGVLGKADDAARYGALADEIRRAFNRRFLKPGTGVYDTGTQACQAFALYLDLVPPEERENAMKVLARDIHEHRDHLTTGIFGTRFLPQVLTEGGRTDLAFTMVNQKDFPGWGYMLDRGATTLWEHWAFSDNTYSHNHPMFGSVGEWFSNTLGGIRLDPSAPAFKEVTIKPTIVGAMTWTNVQHMTPYGWIESYWRREEDRVTLDIDIPTNTAATVYVPSENSATVTEDGHSAAKAEGVKFLRMENGAAVFRVGSGRYQFESTLPRKLP